MTAVFPFPLQAVTARRQLRKAVIAALKRAQLSVGTSAVSVDSPGDWPYQQAKLPAVCVRAPTDNKQSLTKGNTDYTTTVEVDVRAAVSATTAEAAQDAIELLWFQIEQAILQDFYVIELVQNVPSIESTFEIKADAQVHLAGAIGKFRFETFETFDVAQSAQIDADGPWSTDASSTPEAPPSVASPLEPLTEITVDVTRQGSNPPYSEQPGDVGLIITLPED